MRKFTLFMMSLFLMLGTAMAQNYSLTETCISSGELNAKTAPTLIAIKNLSRTNNYYFVGNTGAVPYSAADFSDAAVFVWQPVEEGVAGSYYLMKLDGTYMQATSSKDFGTVDGAAVFTTTNPTTAGTGSAYFNGDGDSQGYIVDEALLVRFVNAAGTWINVQNGDNGTPTYNSGSGGWTVHHVYAVEEAAVEPEPETPFEVVAVTPSEAVTELSTITVEFSEEIAGKQDIMDTMNYIYVGSKTNACNFTVDGKVLTITLWTPITAAGEYALYVPAGVGITRASNGEAVTVNGEIKFTVEEPAAEFEVVAVTPSEPVAELSTITIEFSEEIAGEQDIMDTMNYIYVGSKTNACNFTVDGKVLTITLWTPITAPGEYALKVPASVGITRASNGEAVVIDGEITFTVEEAVVEPEPENMAKVYQITAKDTARGALYATAENTHLTHCGATYENYHNKDIAVNTEDINQQFAFVEYEGAQYLYSLGAQKFAVKDGQYIKLTENPEGFVTVVDSDVEGYKNIMLNGTNKLNFSGGYSHGCVANWEYADDGNRVLLTEVGDFDATELLASMEAYFVAEAEALAAARDEFNVAYAEAQAILTEANLQTTTEAITLQATDEAAAGYVWANTYANGEEGVIAYLVDGNTGTYFHTDWGSYATDGTKDYIEVDLGEGNSISEFCINYVTRHNAGTDFPTSITLLGSNDKSEYTEIATISEGLPVGQTKYYTSPILGNGNEYRYIRYQVNSTSRGDATIPYFHLAEFGISAVSATIAEKYADLVTAVSNLQVVTEAHANNAEYDKEDLIAATEAIEDALFNIYKDDNTIALIESANEILAIEGVGYPATTPREALKAAIATAEEKPDTEAGTALQAAIDAYYATTDVVLPEGDKVYSLTMVAKNGNKFYLNYTGSDIAMVARTTEEELPNSAKFAAEDNGDGTISLKTIDGKYLVYHSKYAGLNWLQGGGDTDGLQETKDDMTNITFAKMVNGDKVEATGNEQIFGMLTWYGKRGYDTGKSEDCYGYMVLKTDGSDYDGASVPFWNDSYSSAFIVEETEYIVEPLNVVAVTPAEDEVVNSLREITIEFDAEIAVKELSDTERISIDYGWGVLIGTTATVEGKLLKLVADTEITYNGTYPLTIPAGVVTRVSDGVAYEGGTFTFTVEKAAVVIEPLTVVAVTPAEAVETLETITIEFSDNVDVPATASGKFTIADADGNTVATLYAWDAAVDGKVVTLTLAEAITTAGEYTFSFAEGFVARQGDQATCAYTCTITVTGGTGIDGINSEDGESVIYDITGRKIEKITEGGIYIVNGKKVLVK